MAVWMSLDLDIFTWISSADFCVGLFREMGKCPSWNRLYLPESTLHLRWRAHGCVVASGAQD